MRSPAHRGAALALLGVLAALLTGCGVTSEDEPRALSVATSTTAVANTPTNGGTAAVLYFTEGNTLAPVTRSLPDRRIGTVLNALFEGPDAVEAESGIGTSIPAGSELVEIAAGEAGTLVVDVSESFGNVVGSSRQQAVAQIVMTATEFPEVQRVRFVLDGKELTVSSPTRGDTTTVTACDYASLLPTPEEAAEAGLPAGAVERLGVRRTELEGCPDSAGGG